MSLFPVDARNGGLLSFELFLDHSWKADRWLVGYGLKLLLHWPSLSRNVCPHMSTSSQTLSLPDCDSGSDRCAAEHEEEPVVPDIAQVLDQGQATPEVVVSEQLQKRWRLKCAALFTTEHDVMTIGEAKNEGPDEKEPPADLLSINCTCFPA
eukprot:5894751-Amphidinium_carterae.3